MRLNPVRLTDQPAVGITLYSYYNKFITRTLIDIRMLFQAMGKF